MFNPLIQKLEHGASLTDADRAVLRSASSRSRFVGAHHDLIREGERPGSVHLILEGFACRYKSLSDGRRQIMAFLVPGDFCDLHVAILGAMDHGIATLSGCTVVDIPVLTVEDLTSNHARINRALWWATLVDEGILREWLVNMGRREAPQRLAHLFCELLVRLQTVNLAKDDSYDLPLTQSELGDTLGLSSVHVNRSLQGLRSQGLLTFERGRLSILDVPRLALFAGFDRSYLHLDQRQPA